jgi:hypothetical protein
MIQATLNSIACIILLAHMLVTYECRKLRGKKAGILALYVLGIAINFLLGFYVP